MEKATVLYQVKQACHLSCGHQYAPVHSSLASTSRQTWMQEAQKLFEDYKAAVGGVTDPNQSPEAKRQLAVEAGQLAEAVVMQAAAATAQDLSSAQVLHAESDQPPKPKEQTVPQSPTFTPGIPIRSITKCPMPHFSPLS